MTSTPQASSQRFAHICLKYSLQKSQANDFSDDRTSTETQMFDVPSRASTSHASGGLTLIGPFNEALTEVSPQFSAASLAVCSDGAPSADDISATGFSNLGTKPPSFDEVAAMLRHSRAPVSLGTPGFICRSHLSRPTSRRNKADGQTSPLALTVRRRVRS
jgi:hypothetical protein